MISINEILGKYKQEELPKEHLDNILELLKRVNIIRKEYGKPLKVTSGYRSKEDQIRIYKEKGVTDESKIPMKSRHLYGCAVDFYDPNKELQLWCKANEKLLETVGLWMEDFSVTVNWVHVQSTPPKSGKRWFLP